MELRREHRSRKADRSTYGVQGSPTRAQTAPGKLNRADRAHAGVPAPAGAQPLDWGARLDASRDAPDVSGDGPGYALSRVEGDMAAAEDLLSQVELIAVPAFHRAVAAMDAPAV